MFPDSEEERRDGGAYSNCLKKATEINAKQGPAQEVDTGKYLVRQKL